MTALEAVLLGLIQGLTEFLPISSSAHVQILQAILNIDSMSREQLTAFIATIQLGTELAVLVYFASDIRRVLKSWFANALRPWRNQPADSKLGWLIIVGTLPIVILGLGLQSLVEGEFRSLWVIGFTLIAFGLLLGVADRWAPKKLEVKDLNFKHGLLFGFGQALALIPGVSRSGGTITTGLLLGYTRAAAARYSFLLAIPAVLASGGYQFAKSVADLPTGEFANIAIATAIAFGSGLAVIAWLMRYLARGSFTPFVVYRVLLGSLLLLALAAGWIQDLP